MSNLETSRIWLGYLRPDLNNSELRSFFQENHGPLSFWKVAPRSSDTTFGFIGLRNEADHAKVFAMAGMMTTITAEHRALKVKYYNNHRSVCRHTSPQRNYNGVRGPFLPPPPPAPPPRLDAHDFAKATASSKCKSHPYSASYQAPDYQADWAQPSTSIPHNAPIAPQPTSKPTMQYAWASESTQNRYMQCEPVTSPSSAPIRPQASNPLMHAQVPPGAPPSSISTVGYTSVVPATSHPTPSSSHVPDIVEEVSSLLNTWWEEQGRHVSAGVPSQQALGEGQHAAESVPSQQAPGTPENRPPSSGRYMEVFWEIRRAGRTATPIDHPLPRANPLHIDIDETTGRYTTETFAETYPICNGRLIGIFDGGVNPSACVKNVDCG